MEPKFEELKENERLGLYERNMLQISILKGVGFNSSTPESAEWLAEHRKKISDFIDQGPRAEEIRKLTKERDFQSAAEMVIKELGLSQKNRVM